MSNIIKHIHIEKLFGTTNIDWELNPSVNVLVGKNGSGKSTILRAIYTTLVSDQTLWNDDIDVINKCEITMDNVFTTYSYRLHFLDTSQLNNHKELKNFSQNIKPIPMWGFSGLNYEIISTEFISTINMSANSINNLTTSSGQHTNLLDIEINNEVLRLLAFDNKETLKESLLSALNSLFSETNKIIEFANNKLVVKLTDGTQIDFSQLSSGERQVIFIFLKVVIASVDGALILMDEPEISLHLSWQEKLLNEIRRVNTTSQIIIVTHSPAMLMNGWIDSFVDIENIMTDVSTSNVSISEKDEEKEE
ncbi:MAG: hypothetical protein CR966_00190 [Pseudomonadales bacterium]|nr:MAG: hypothetical protein CR966_00190 [Pseudomonadales bacterium]